MQYYAGYFFIFVAALCWGFLGILGRIAMESGIAPFDVAFWRALIGGGCLFLHALCLKQARVHSKKDFLHFCLFGVFSIASFFVAYQYAVREGGAALASVLLYTAPAWVAVFSRIFFGLRFTLVTGIAIVVALIGGMLISFSPAEVVGMGGAENTEQETPLPVLGILFGLLSGFLYATHYVVTKKLLTRYSSFTLYGYATLVAALCLLPFTNIRLDLGLSAWLALFGTGFLSTYVAYWAYCEAIKRVHPTKVAVLATCEPVIATVAAWYIWGESFSIMGWFGAVLILSTVLIFLIDDRKPLTEK